MRTQVLQLVFSAIDEVNRQLPPERRVDKTEAAALTGADSALDSLAFLSLIVTTEDLVSSTYRRPINLAAALMESDDARPPRTAGELADLIVTRLGGAGHG